MSSRLFLCAGFALCLLAGCAHKKEYVWYRGGSGPADLERDLKLAHAEAEKAYPGKGGHAHGDGAGHAKMSKEAEEMAKKHRSVQALYLEAHGWYLVYYDYRGRMHAAPHGAH